MYELFKHGTAKSTPGDSITEGIGLGRVTPVIETAKVDDAFLISDEEAVKVIYDLLEHEGLCLGGSTGVNVAGAIQLAKQLGPGKTIVTILADSGNRYQSKLFNPEFMRSKNLPVPAWLEKRSEIDVPFEKVYEGGGRFVMRMGAAQHQAVTSSRGIPGLRAPLRATTADQCRRISAQEQLRPSACCGLAKNFCGVFDSITWPASMRHDAVCDFARKSHFVGDDQHGHAFPGEIDHGGRALP